MSHSLADHARAGFTLIEVMAVMLIIAIIAALVVTMVPGTGRAQLKVLTLDTAALLRRERLGAILTGQSRRISLDGRARKLVGESGVVVIPRDVVVDVVGVDEVWSGRQAVVRFEPDGASTGAKLSYAWEGARYEVNVDWYSGGVATDLP
ncbi:prepilin-type N-terminal cleavage/methylation domain-containing protein [Bradyrhizobium prioriisuperbiae]|uniref:prepilin-type N-terminal cleavage/methylation domain-containing protein n=1 Tax=Bradyrhizobium prioriisuperbiae TaxID=2854389 RepID=UPI0028E1BC2B|nr:prepilin-type N-terminal cleavage/methylation domain-containing protein [Bradyrhizobium prioritasuperba]